MVPIQQFTLIKTVILQSCVHYSTLDDVTVYYVYICCCGTIAESITDNSENAQDAIFFLIMLTWKQILDELVQPLTWQ